MDKKSPKYRAAESVKTVLILLLSCSAVFLLTRTSLSASLSGLLSPAPETNAAAGQSLPTDQSATAWPLRVAAVAQRESQVLRYGVQYDAQTSDAFFQQTASLLVEALSSMESPREISQRQWRTALQTAPGLYYDFQGELPLSVLSGWLTRQPLAVEGTARRLVLTVLQDRVSLCYQDAEDGLFYSCVTDLVSLSQLEEAASPLGDNGAFFAFESEDYPGLDPYTLLLPDTVQPKVYQASNPLSGTQDGLNALLADLYFPAESVSFYSAGDEQVARSGSESVRLSADGVVVYQSDDPSSGRYLISGSATPAETAETCRFLAQRAAGTRCGEARLYLISMEQTENGWQLDFGYSLNSIQVQLGTGYAARFLVKDGRLSWFELRLRSYADSGQTSSLLPERQAAAAMEGLGHQGDELLLVYPDSGGDTVSATWAAAGTLQSRSAGR